MSTSRYSLGAKLLLFVTTVLLVVLLLEFGLRVMTRNEYQGEDAFIQPIRIRGPHMDFVLSRRLVDPEHDSVKLRTDDRSYILPAKRYEDPEKTIVFFGGSTTECAAVREETRFPALVSTMLEEDGHKVNTLNVALSGNTLHDSINVLLNHSVLDHPDIAVVMHASNDIGVTRKDPEYRSRMARPLGSSDLLLGVKRFVSTRSYLISRIRYTISYLSAMGVKPNTGIREQNVMSGEIFPLKPIRQRLLAFISVARSFNIEPVLMTQPYSQFRTELTPEWQDDTVQDRVNDLIREIGIEQNVLVIDLMQHLKESVPNFNEPMNVFYDAIHVTDKGSTIYARYIADALERKFLEKQ